MLKTKEELNKLKEEMETLNKKLAELTYEELKQVTGGIHAPTFGEISKEERIKPRYTHSWFGDKT